jgi:hypothetical protein
MYTGTFIVVMILNQLIFFGFCLNPVCLIAAMPHVLVITAFLGSWINKEKGWGKDDEIAWEVSLWNWAYANNISKSVIPNSQLKLQHLSELKLSSKYLKLPNEIGNLTALFILDLQNCEYIQLPPTINKLQNLTLLNLENSVGVSIPNQLGSLKNLNHLNIAGTGMDTVPKTICDLPNLQHLDISRNQINILPSEITKLTNLKTFYLNGNKNLKITESQLQWLRCLKRNGCEVDFDIDNFDLKRYRKPNEPETLKTTAQYRETSEELLFTTFKEASEWAKNNPGASFSRSKNGAGYVGSIRI